MAETKSPAADMLGAWAEEIGQTEVARALGKSQPTISRWIAEKGAPPDYETRRRAWKKKRIPMAGWWAAKRRARGASASSAEVRP